MLVCDKMILKRGGGVDVLVISSVHMDKESLEESLKLVGYDNEELFAYLQQKALGNPLIEVKINKEFDERAVKEKTVVYKPDKDDPMDTASAMDQVSEEVPALDTFLLEQIYANMRDTPLRDLVLFLVAFINPEGYVTINLNEAAEQKGVEPIEMLDALTLLHQLDPPGVGARNLQECLMLQTERDEYAPEIAYYVLENFFTAFSDKNWQEIADEMAVDLADVKSVFEYVQSLDPTPGSAFGDDNLFLPRPDLYLQLLDGHLTVKYNEWASPFVVFQKEYYEEMLQHDDEDVQQFLAAKKTEGEQLRSALAFRKELLLAAGELICSLQKGFFLEGRELEPLDVTRLAEDLAVPVTVMREEILEKMIETDRGTFLLHQLCGE